MMKQAIGFRVFAVAAIAGSSVLAISLIHPGTRARASAPNPDTLVQCSTETPCAEFKNTGHGSAIEARSLKGTTVKVLSRQGTAIVGTSLGAPLNKFYITAGVIGNDNSTNGLPNTGVFGVTSAPGDAGVQGAFAAYGPTGLFGVGVLGFDESGPGTNRNVIGVLGESEGTGVFGLSMATPAPPGQQQSPGINAACAGGGVALLASNGFVSPAGDLMSVDCAGNMILKGTVLSGGTPLMLVNTKNGPSVAAYPLAQSDRNIEDVGEAQLIDGAADVRLDTRFASTIDFSRPYMVFVTPDGPSRGLYVTNKTRYGFSVRENPGGRSTLTFDYRIVAKPFGSGGARLPAVNDVEMGFYRQTVAAPHSTQSAARWVQMMTHKKTP